VADLLEKQIQDAVIARIEGIIAGNIVDVADDRREVQNQDMVSGSIYLRVGFGFTKSEAAIGHYINYLPVFCAMSTRIDSDPDLSATKTALEALIAEAEQAIIPLFEVDDNDTWGDLAVTTRRGNDRPWKVGHGSQQPNETEIEWNYSIEYWTRPDNPYNPVCT